MKINREAFLKSLQVVKAAIGSDSPLESLRYIWFDQERNVAFAYNDVIGLEAPVERLELDGGVGVELLNVLDKSSAADVDLTPKETEINFVVGRSKGKVPFRPRDEGTVQPFPVNAKEPKRIAKAEFTKDIVAALKHVMVSAAASGVTVVPSGSDLMLYTTDGATISWAHCLRPDKYPESIGRLSFSTEFCERFMSLMGESAELELIEGGAIVTFKDTGVRLFGKLLLEEPPLDYSGRVSKAIPEDVSIVPIPAELSEALARVEVLTGTKVPKIQMEVEKDELMFEFHGDLGEVFERCKLSEKVKEPVTSNFNAEHIKRGLSSAKYFLVTPKAFLLQTDEGFGYVCAAIR